ncbi:MAG: choice-of-anchor J domain-containing protein [candidate division WOR-3 bacterium]
MLLAFLALVPEKMLSDAALPKGTTYAHETKAGAKAGVGLSMFSEDVESGSRPPGWAIRDSNADGQSWMVRPSSGWHITAMPPAPGSYMICYDDDAIGWNPETEEELISPSIYVAGHDTLRLIYGLGYQNFKGQDTFEVRVRFHDGTDWGAWQALAVYDWDIGSGVWDTLNLWAWLPAESLQVSFLWFDHTWLHWDWYVAIDNISVEYLLSLPVNLTASAILSPKALEEEGALIKPSLRIVNTGNQDIQDNISAGFVISDTSGILYEDTKTIVGGIQRGDSVDILFSGWPAGPQGGPYTAMGFLSYQDSFPGDDTCQTRFGVIPDSVARRIMVPYFPNAPTIDGTLGPGEWDSSASWDASDYLGRDGWTDYPGSIALRAFHDASFLYLACDALADTGWSDSSEAWVCLDDDAGGSWPSADTTEGANRLINPDLWLCSWFRADFTHGPWYESGLSSFAFGQTGGHTTIEIALILTSYDAGPQFVGANPVPDGDSIGIHIFYLDQAHGTMACWPQDVLKFYDPARYGRLYLEPFSGEKESSCPTAPSLRVASVMRGEAPISLTLPEKTKVSLGLYDGTGRLIFRLFEGEMEAGIHWFKLILPSSGVYFLRARAGSWSKILKLVWLD